MIDQPIGSDLDKQYKQVEKDSEGWSDFSKAYSADVLVSVLADMQTIQVRFDNLAQYIAVVENTTTGVGEESK